MSWSGAFDPLFYVGGGGGRGFVHNDCPGGRVFEPFESCPGSLSFGMANDESDSCVSERLQNVHPGKVNYWVNDLPRVQHPVALGLCEQASV